MKKQEKITKIILAILVSGLIVFNIYNLVSIKETNKEILLMEQNLVKSKEDVILLKREISNNINTIKDEIRAIKEMIRNNGE
jgi:hypothetical protein